MQIRVRGDTNDIGAVAATRASMRGILIVVELVGNDIQPLTRNTPFLGEPSRLHHDIIMSCTLVSWVPLHAIPPLIYG